LKREEEEEEKLTVTLHSFRSSQLVGLFVSPYHHPSMLMTTICIFFFRMYSITHTRSCTLSVYRYAFIKTKSQESFFSI